MYKTMQLILVLCMSLAFFSCSTMDDVMKGMEAVEKISSKTPAGSSSTVMEAGTKAGGIDFRKGEVLSSRHENKSLIENTFAAAKVLTSASSATQGQAEVLFADGTKKWVIQTVPSHKADKSELETGKLVLFMYLYSVHEEITERDYRYQNWQFGRVTSTDELFKNKVEIDGRSCFVKWIRISDDPVE